MPTIQELPPPPAGRTGWPWTEGTSAPTQTPVGGEWPRITLITPSFRQAQYIEETIRSVLLQNYPNLEYYIMDGGSTDGTVEVIKKYEKWITGWVSEKDRGQSHAINKGLERATGSLINWINSDDYLTPGALLALGLVHAQNPSALLAGHYRLLMSDSAQYPRRVMGVDAQSLAQYWKAGFNWNQAAIFFTKEMVEKCGMVRENLHFGMDYELFLRFTNQFPTVYLDRELAVFRLHAESKTISKAESFLDEVCTSAEKNWPPKLERPDFAKTRRIYAAIYWSGLAMQSLLHVKLGAFAGNFGRALRQSWFTAITRLFGPKRVLRLWRERKWNIG